MGVKLSKNNPDNKNKSNNKSNLKYSFECSQCIDKTGGCDAGIRYKYQVEVLKKCGHGCNCKKEVK
jgi:hypothetical protein